MELQRILENDPESSAFYAAKKTLRNVPLKRPVGRGAGPR